ncbi:unnamed protein product [Prunus armeniaca]
MDGAKVVSTPLSTTGPLMLHDGSSPIDATHCRCLICGLQYLSLTRPDISFTVNKLSQFIHSPFETHWQALKRLLRYLKGTISFGVHLSHGFSLYCLKLASLFPQHQLSPVISVVRLNRKYWKPAISDRYFRSANR